MVFTCNVQAYTRPQFSIIIEGAPFSDTHAYLAHLYAIDGFFDLASPKYQGMWRHETGNCEDDRQKEAIRKDKKHFRISTNRHQSTTPIFSVNKYSKMKNDAE